MKYYCQIINVDDDEVTVKIGDTLITGFVNCGTEKKQGDEAIVNIILYGDLCITQCSEHAPSLERKVETFQYTLWGVLDIDNAILRSAIDIEIDKEELFDYSYLDGNLVKIDVLRIDFDFEE